MLTTQKVIEVPATSSAVNHFKITNSASSSNPVLEATGDDTNVGFSLGSEGNRSNYDYSTSRSK